MATPAILQPRRSFWSSLAEAIRGSHQDYTEGSISRAIFLLATPMVLEMLMESLFAVVDVFWVTRLGANAIATVGLTESLMTLVFSVAFGVSLSTTAMVARRIGEKDSQGAATAAVQALNISRDSGSERITRMVVATAAVLAPHSELEAVAGLRAALAETPAA